MRHVGWQSSLNILALPNTAPVPWRSGLQSPGLSRRLAFLQALNPKRKKLNKKELLSMILPFGKSSQEPD